MTISLSSFVIQANNLVPDISTDELSAINIRQQVKQAVRLYSIDAPDEVTVDVAGDGGRYYAVSNLAKWADEFSSVLSIQYPAPAVASDETPVYLDNEDWDDRYYDGSTRYIYLPNHSPAAGESFRVRYTAPYLWSASATTTAISAAGHGFSLNDGIYQDSNDIWQKTDDVQLLATHIVTAVADVDNYTRAELVCDVPTMHFFAICQKAACLICQQIAARYSRTSDSTISADSVAHTSRAEQFASRAREFCQAYATAVNLGGGDGKGSGVAGYAQFVDWDTAPGWPRGRDFIFHGRYDR